MTIIEASAAPRKDKTSLPEIPNEINGRILDSMGISSSSLFNDILSRTDKKKSSGSSSIASSILGFGRKHGIDLGSRKSSYEEPRNFE